MFMIVTQDIVALGQCWVIGWGMGDGTPCSLSVRRVEQQLMIALCQTNFDFHHLSG